MKVTILNLVSLLWQDIINFIHSFDGHSKDKLIRKYSKELRTNGIIKIENFLDTNFCDSLRNEIELLALENPYSVELHNGTKFDYRSHDKVNGPDHGMLDIFYIEKSIQSVQSVDHEILVKILKSACGQEIIPLRANAYINDSVQNTRGYHIDNTQPVVYKAFIYLTDVIDTSYGPYSFVKKSHRFSFYTYLNIIRNYFIKKNNSTDAPLFDKKLVTHCLGKKGTLVLSNQNAIHRGLPQASGKRRVALVLSFMINSKLSYIHKSAKKNLMNNIK